MEQWEVERALVILDGWIKAIEDYVPSWQDPTHPAYDPTHPDFVEPPPERPLPFQINTPPREAREPRRRIKKAPQRPQQIEDSTAAAKMRDRVRTKRLKAMERIAKDMEHISFMLTDDDTDLAPTTRRHLIDRFEELREKFETLEGLVKRSDLEHVWRAKQSAAGNAARPIILDSGAQVLYTDSESPAAIISTGRPLSREDFEKVKSILAPPGWRD